MDPSSTPSTTSSLYESQIRHSRRRTPATSQSSLQSGESVVTSDETQDIRSPARLAVHVAAVGMLVICACIGTNLLAYWLIQPTDQPLNSTNAHSTDKSTTQQYTAEPTVTAQDASTQDRMKKGYKSQAEGEELDPEEGQDSTKKAPSFPLLDAFATIVVAIKLAKRGSLLLPKWAQYFVLFMAANVLCWICYQLWRLYSLLRDTCKAIWKSPLFFGFRSLLDLIQDYTRRSSGQYIVTRPHPSNKKASPTREGSQSKNLPHVSRATYMTPSRHRGLDHHLRSDGMATSRSRLSRESRHTY